MAALTPVSSITVPPSLAQTTQKLENKQTELPAHPSSEGLAADTSAKETELVWKLNTQMALQLFQLLENADEKITQGAKSTANAQVSLQLCRNAADHSDEARKAEAEISVFEEQLNKSRICFAEFKTKLEQLTKQLADGKKADAHKKSAILGSVIAEVNGLISNIEKALPASNEQLARMNRFIDKYYADLSKRGRIFKDKPIEINALGTITGMLTCHQIDKQYQINVTQKDSAVQIKTASFTTTKKSETYTTVDEKFATFSGIRGSFECTKHILVIQGIELLAESKGSSPRKFTILFEVHTIAKGALLYGAAEPKITWE